MLISGLFVSLFYIAIFSLITSIRSFLSLHVLTKTKFIRHLEIPYCPLYDKGYTSLGGTTDTHRNPALRRQSVSGSGTPSIEFRPAYELIEDEEERLGRDWERRKMQNGEATPLAEKEGKKNIGVDGSD
jgi:3'-phosphoadenosine 5'-phosphosulfate sulfotransferase (PAPS reductase)/FAD synthetase